MKVKFTLLLFFLGFVACNDADKKNNSSPTEKISTKTDTISSHNIEERIAERAGINNWDSIRELSFTFNVDRDGNHMERSWIWEPKTDKVRMIKNQDTIEYNRKEINSESKEADKAFINDKFWLLAAFQPVWDEGVKITYEDKATAPISKDTLARMTVVYGDEGGYTPGDAYDFFYDDSYLIKEWNYRKGNDSLPTISTTWEDYKDFDGISLATNHQDGKTDFRMYFTNISVKSNK